MPGSRRGSLAGYVSDMESKGQWQSLGSESNKSPLANFGFFKNLTEKKTTRGLQLDYRLHLSQLNKYRWATAQKKRAETRQQTGPNPEAGA